MTRQWGEPLRIPLAETKEFQDKYDEVFAKHVDLSGKVEVEIREWGDTLDLASKQEWEQPLVKTDEEFFEGQQWGQPKQFNSASQLLIFEQAGKQVNRACSVVGSLAIHDDLVDPNCFQISHIPTRTSFMGAVPAIEGMDYDEARLIAWCKAVQQRLPEHWTALNGLTPENYKSNIDRVKLNELREWCLSWPI